MLQFDEATTRILEDAYLGADISRRRRCSFDLLDLRAGDRVLDIGCGAGHLTVDLSRAVGKEGLVIGLDPSGAMLDAARRRCSGCENVTFETGSAEAIPLEDGAVDKAVSLQVFEYFDDIDRPLAEAFRVLRPGGRLVIGDMLWSTLVWHSDAPERMDRITAGWDRHLARREVPRVLAGHLRAAGFTGCRATAQPFLDTVLRPDGLARMILVLIERYVVANGIVSAAEARAWHEEQLELGREGRFFFHLLHVVWTATRPAA